MIRTFDSASLIGEKREPARKDPDLLIAVAKIGDHMELTDHWHTFTSDKTGFAGYHRIMFFLRAFAVWLLIITAESIHGALRQAFVAPAIGDFNSRRIAFFVGLLLIFALASITVRWLAAPDRRALYLAGLLWMVLTACFEIGLGRFVLGFGWERIFEDYDIRRGGLMGFGLIFLLFAPTLAAAARKVRPDR